MPSRWPQLVSAGFLTLSLLTTTVSGISTFPSSTHAEPAPTASTAVSVVKQRIDAFNAGNLEGYLKAHHPEVKIYRYPDRLLGTGRDHLERIFGEAIESKSAKVEVIDQWVLNDVVVSRERLTLAGASEEVISLYSVDGDTIRAYRQIVRPRPR